MYIVSPFGDVTLYHTFLKEGMKGIDGTAVDRNELPQHRALTLLLGLTDHGWGSILKRFIVARSVKFVQTQIAFSST